MDNVWLMQRETGDYYVEQELVGIFTSLEQAKKSISKKDLLSRWDEKRSQNGEFWIEGTLIIEGYGEVRFQLEPVALDKLYGLEWQRRMARDASD